VGQGRNGELGTGMEQFQCLFKACRQITAAHAVASLTSDLKKVEKTQNSCKQFARRHGTLYEIENHSHMVFLFYKIMQGVSNG
jgi:hypothetical protein